MVEYLALRLQDAVQQAMHDHEQPELVFATAPAVFAALSGTHLQTLYTVGIVADGELDARLAANVQLMKDAADPSKGHRIPTTDIHGVRQLRGGGGD